MLCVAASHRRALNGTVTVADRNVTNWLSACNCTKTAIQLHLMRLICARYLCSRQSVIFHSRSSLLPAHSVTAAAALWMQNCSTLRDLFAVADVCSCKLASYDACKVFNQSPKPRKPEFCHLCALLINSFTVAVIQYFHRPIYSYPKNYLGLGPIYSKLFAVISSYLECYELWNKLCT